MVENHTSQAYGGAPQAVLRPQVDPLEPRHVVALSGVASVTVLHREGATWVALFGPASGRPPGPSALHIAEQTLAQEVAQLDTAPDKSAIRDIPSMLSELAARVDLALRVTHPTGAVPSQGALVLARLSEHGIHVAATRGGSAAVMVPGHGAIVEHPGDAEAAAPTIGGPLGGPPVAPRLGQVCLPPLEAGERLVLATATVDRVFSNTELDHILSNRLPGIVPAKLQQLAKVRGCPHLTATLVCVRRPGDPLDLPGSPAPRGGASSENGLQTDIVSHSPATPDAELVLAPWEAPTDHDEPEADTSPTLAPPVVPLDRPNTIWPLERSRPRRLGRHGLLIVSRTGWLDIPAGRMPSRPKPRPAPPPLPAAVRSQRHELLTTWAPAVLIVGAVVAAIGLAYVLT